MRKRLLALVLCAVLVSALAATTAVSARQVGTSFIRQYDVHQIDSSWVIGKLTLNLKTGHYVCDVNYAKILGCDAKQQVKEWGGELTLVFAVYNDEYMVIGPVIFSYGGTGHGEGTIVHPIVLDLLRQHSDDVVIFSAGPRVCE